MQHPWRTRVVLLPLCLLAGCVGPLRQYPAFPPAAEPASAPEATLDGGVRALESPPPEPPPAPPPLPVAEPTPPVAVGVPSLSRQEVEHLLEVSRRLVTYRRVKVGRRGDFQMDCSGFVRAVHLSLGLDLFAPRVEGRALHAGGVGLVLWYNQAHGTFWPRSGPPETYAAEPLPGDIVYFHDTYDRNRNRRFDDPFTHVGLVESVDGEGTVTFLHAAGHVVKREKMNLRHPHDTRDAAGNPINHTLRFRTRWEKKEDPRLASELFAGYGRLGRPAFAAEWSPEAAVAVQPHGKSFQKGTRRGGSHRRSKAAPHAPKARGSRR